MTKKFEPKDFAAFEELLLNAVYTQDALVTILEKKGIMNREELQREIDTVKREHSCYVKK